MSDNDNFQQIYPPVIAVTISELEPIINEYGLPLHVVFKSNIREQADSFKAVANKYYPETMICFAVKSNPCLGAVRAMKELDLGVDAVSVYELDAALKTGISPNKIVCNGNAKTDEYLQKCLLNEVLIAADCTEELEVIDNIANKLQIKARTMLRVSRMPLEGYTTSDQTTASAWTKFGFPYNEIEDVLKLVKNLPWIEYCGVSAHIGTQICELNGYVTLMNHLLMLIRTAEHIGMPTRFVDIGGGFPISYISRFEWENFTVKLGKQLDSELSFDKSVSWDDTPMGYEHLKGSGKLYPGDWRGKAYWSHHPGSNMLESLLISKSDNGKNFIQRLRELDSPTLIVEPGRSLIGPAGITVAKVVAVKKVLGNWVIMLDMGIVNHGTNLISADIYPMKVLPEKLSDEPVEAFLGGRLCFTGDMISKVKIKINRLPVRGEMVVIYHTGAYCADHFSSNSCGYPQPAKIAIGNRGNIEVWRLGQEFSDVFK